MQLHWTGPLLGAPYDIAAVFFGTVCLRNVFIRGVFIRVIVKLSYILSNISEYQGSETSRDFFGQN